jgi:hypothetical protein
VNVDTPKHFTEPEFTGRPEAAAPIPFPGIPVRGKKHIPHGKIRIVEGVNAFLMMNAMTLGPLKNVSKPMRCFYIPVIHQFGQAAQHDRTCCGSRFNTHSEVQNSAHEQAIEKDFKWMFIKTGDYFYALRAVMNLMNPTPEKRRSVAPTMPPVKDKGNREITEEGLTEGA